MKSYYETKMLLSEKKKKLMEKYKNGMIDIFFNYMKNA